MRIMSTASQYHRRADGLIVPGDCGAWVVNANTGLVYGHIVAGDPVTGTAFIIPAHKVFSDIEHRFGSRPALSTEQPKPRIAAAPSYIVLPGLSSLLSLLEVVSKTRNLIRATIDQGKADQLWSDLLKELLSEIDELKSTLHNVLLAIERPTSNPNLLVTCTPWRAASVLIICLIMSTSHILTLQGLVELDQVSPRGPSAYRFRWLQLLRYLLADYFPEHRMCTCKTALEFVSHFEAAHIRHFRLAVDSTPLSRTILDRSTSCLRLAQKAALSNFERGGFNEAVLREEQVRKALSEIGTDSGKKVSVGCPIPAEGIFDANSLTSKFEDLLRTRRMNHLADLSRQREKLSEQLHRPSLSTRSLSRQAPRLPTEQTNGLSAYSSLRNHPQPYSEVSLRFQRRLSFLLSLPRNWDSTPSSRPSYSFLDGLDSFEWNCEAIMPPLPHDGFGFRLGSLIEAALPDQALAAPSQNRCRGRQRYVSSNRLQPDTPFNLDSDRTKFRRKRLTFVREPRCSAVWFKMGSLQRASAKESRCPYCEFGHCSWNSTRPWRMGHSDRHIISLHGNQGEHRLHVWSFGSVLSTATNHSAYYNAAAHLRRVHFNPKMKDSQLHTKLIDDRRDQEGNHWSSHLKQRDHEREIVIQPPLNISSSLMDGQVPIAVVGMPTRLHCAETQDAGYYILFPYSEYNLPFPTERNVRWLQAQFRGLSSALRDIHNLSNSETGQSLPNHRLTPNSPAQQSGWHHDLIPQNILYFKRDALKAGSFKIADFESGTVHTYRLGTGSHNTYTYEPTEAAKKEAISRPIDVFSLGCVFIEMLIWATGHRRDISSQNSSVNSRGLESRFDMLEMNFDRDKFFLVSPREDNCVHDLLESLAAIVRSIGRASTSGLDFTIQQYTARTISRKTIDQQTQSRKQGRFLIWRVMDTDVLRIDHLSDGIALDTVKALRSVETADATYLISFEV